MELLVLKYGFLEKNHNIKNKKNYKGKIRSNIFF